MVKFRAGLKAKLGLDVSLKLLKAVLRRNLYYQTAVIKPKKFKTRHVYSPGVGVEGLTDSVYLYIPETKRERGTHFPNEDNVAKKNSQLFVFQIVQDLLSRFVYCQTMKVVNPSALKKAFNTLFRQGMPNFSVIRCDMDKS